MSADRYSTATINDLLHYEDEAIRRPKAPESRLSQAGKIVLRAAIYSTLIIFAVRPFRVGLPVLLVFPGVLALILLRRVLGRVDVVPAERPVLRPPATTVPAQDGLFAAATRWDTRLSWTQSDLVRFNRLVHPSIVELANERLRQRHNCTITSDPVRAQELLGAPLWTFLTTPVTRSPTPRELAAVVAQLEGL